MNLHIGSYPTKVDNFDISLDENIIRIVKLLARQAAEKDFKEALKNNPN